VDVLDRNRGELTLFYPHNRSFVHLPKATESAGVPSEFPICGLRTARRDIASRCRPSHRNSLSKKTPPCFCHRRAILKSSRCQFN